MNVQVTVPDRGVAAVRVRPLHDPVVPEIGAPLAVKLTFPAGEAVPAVTARVAVTVTAVLAVMLIGWALVLVGERLNVVGSGPTVTLDVALLETQLAQSPAPLPDVGLPTGQ